MSTLTNRNKYTWLKSTLEETLMLVIGKLDLKDQDDKEIYDSICASIEKADAMSSHFADEYDNNSLFI